MTNSDDTYRPLDYLDHSLISPNGRMSKQARDRAISKLSAQLWPGGCTRKDITGAAEEMAIAGANVLRRSAANLRQLADRGMSPRKFRRKADELDKQADELETER